MKEPAIINISPKGDLNIPRKFMKHCPSQSYILHKQGDVLFLQPADTAEGNRKTDPLKYFHFVAESSLSFWKSKEDTGNEPFYKDAPNI